MKECKGNPEKDKPAGMQRAMGQGCESSDSRVEGWAQILQALLGQDLLKQRGSPKAWGAKGKGEVFALWIILVSRICLPRSKEGAGLSPTSPTSRGAARKMQVRDDGSEGAGMEREGLKSYFRREE